MGKRQGRNLDLLPCEYTQKRIQDAPIEDLLYVGRLVCSTDYAIRFFKNKNHPKFYKNEEAVRHAIRRAYSQGAFDHAKQIGDALFDESSFEEYLNTKSDSQKQKIAQKFSLKSEKRARMGMDRYHNNVACVIHAFVNKIKEEKSEAPFNE